MLGALSISDAVEVVAVAVPPSLTLVDLHVDNGVIYADNFVTLVAMCLPAAEDLLFLGFDYSISDSTPSFSPELVTFLAEAESFSANEDWDPSILSDGDGDDVTFTSLGPIASQREEVSYTTPPGFNYAGTGSIDLEMPIPAATGIIQGSFLVRYWDGQSTDASGNPLYNAASFGFSILSICPLPGVDGLPDEVPDLSDPLPITFTIIDCTSEVIATAESLIPTYTFASMGSYGGVMLRMPDYCYSTIKDYVSEAACDAYSVVTLVAMGDSDGCDGTVSCNFCSTVETLLNTASAATYLIDPSSMISSPIAADTKETLAAGGRVGIQFAPESIDVARSVNFGGGTSYASVLAGSPPAGTPPVAAIGRLRIDLPSAGTFEQDVEVWDAAWHAFGPNSPGVPTAAKWWALAGCGAATLAYAGATFATLGATAVAGLGVVSLCAGAYYIISDDGVANCGIVPAGVTWGPQSASGTLLPPIVTSSTGVGTTTVYYDDNGDPTDSGEPIPVAIGTSYREGTEACEAAMEASTRAAEAAAQNYGSTHGDGEGAVTATIPVTVVIDSSFQYVRDNIFWSPIHGLAVGCSALSGCPLEISLSVSQSCGLVVVKGGDPAEATYTFTGDPSCPATVTVQVNAGDPPASIPIDGVILSMEYQGAGQ
jgi:hypothetical protein